MNHQSFVGKPVPYFYTCRTMLPTTDRWRDGNMCRRGSFAKHQWRQLLRRLLKNDAIGCLHFFLFRPRCLASLACSLVLRCLGGLARCATSPAKSCIFIVFA